MNNQSCIFLFKPSGFHIKTKPSGLPPHKLQSLFVDAEGSRNMVAEIVTLMQASNFKKQTCMNDSIAKPLI